MKTKIQLFVVVLILSATNLFSQENKKFSFSEKTEGIKSVKISLEGDIQIYESANNTLKCDVEIIKEGEVWGISNKNSRAGYKLAIKKEKGVLMINPVQRAGLWTMGVTNYKESIKIRIFIPQHLQLHIFLKNSKLEVYSNFAELKIENNGNTSLTLNKTKISNLRCQTKGNKIEVDGQFRSTEYELQSIGNENYSVISDNINIVLK